MIATTNKIKFISNLEAIITKMQFPIQKPIRLKVNIGGLNLIAWLSQQEFERKLFWQSQKKDFQVAAVGSTHDILDPNEIDSALEEFGNDFKLFGGFEFQSPKQEHSQLWKDYPGFLFYLPRFEIIETEGAYSANLNLVSGDDQESVLSFLNQISPNQQLDETNSNTCIDRIDIPNKDDWFDLLDNAKAEMANGTFQKVVLARCTNLRYENKINPYSLLNKLHSDEASFTFCLQLKQDFAFLGRSPELLLRHRRSKLESDAVAGNRKSTDAEQLQTSKKDKIEHSYVVKDIADTLRDFVKDINISELSLLNLDRVSHLYSKIKATLKEKVKAFEIVRELHPTPALGGSPKKPALNFIQSQESFNRGWYGAPFGWLSNQSSEFAVAIRSALIKANEINIFAGAGIIDKSVNESEWNELEAKIANFIDILS